MLNSNKKRNYNMSFDDIFKCGLCLELMKAPVTLKNSNCTHNFCYDCYVEWSQSDFNKKCPICNVEVSSNEHIPATVIWEIMDMHYNDIECTCLERFHTQADIYHHKIEKCEKGYEKCNNCSKLVLYNNLENHKFNICENRLITCTYCSKSIKFCKKKHHEYYECLEFEVLCQFCNSKILKKNLQAHNSRCVNTHFQCVCLKMVERSQAESHWADERCDVDRVCPICNKHVYLYEFKEHFTTCKGSSFEYVNNINNNPFLQLLNSFPESMQQFYFVNPNQLN